MSLLHQIKKIERFLSIGDIDSSIKLLGTVVSTTDNVHLKQEYLAISSRYQRSLSNRSQGLIDQSKSSLIFNQTVDAIQQVIAKIHNYLSDGDNSMVKPVMVELTIKGDYNSFSDEDQKTFLLAIQHFLKLKSDIKIVNKQSGSIRLSFQLSEHDAQRLQKGIQSGALSGLGIIGIRISPIRLDPFSMGIKSSLNNFQLLEQQHAQDYAENIDRVRTQLEARLTLMRNVVSFVEFFAAGYISVISGLTNASPPSQLLNSTPKAPSQKVDKKQAGEMN